MSSCSIEKILLRDTFRTNSLAHGDRVRRVRIFCTPCTSVSSAHHSRSTCLCHRYDFLGKDSDKPEQANGTAAPGKSSDERRHRERRSSKDRDRGDRHRERDTGDRREHRSDSRDHRSHRSSRPRDDRDHRSHRDDRPRDDRPRYREDPRGQDSFKRPRTQEFLPRPPPPRYVYAAYV